MAMVKNIVLAVFFFLELAALTAVGYWGFHLHAKLPVQIVLGICAPLLIAVIWGMFVSPKALIPVPVSVRVLLQLVVFGLASAALHAAGQKTLAAAFLVTALLEMALSYGVKNMRYH